MKRLSNSKSTPIEQGKIGLVRKVLSILIFNTDHVKTRKLFYEIFVSCSNLIFIVAKFK